ncbi:hypothetical protein ACU8KH_04402 [Lachancea thermotolerans]
MPVPVYEWRVELQNWCSTALRDTTKTPCSIEIYLKVPIYT